MTHQETEDKINIITHKIVQMLQPERIVLFGSWAWGEPDPDSDVDLLIVKDSPQPRRERQRDLRRKLYPPGLPLDLLVYTPQEVDERLNAGDFFIRNVLTKGKILYAAPR